MTNPSQERWQALATAYSGVTAFLYAERRVNGRTILDTTEPRRKGNSLSLVFRNPRHRSTAWGIVLFVIAMMLELLVNWAGGISDPTKLSGIYAFAYAFSGALSAFLIPAVWGGIGAGIFLMKRISDKLFEMAYEKARVKGDMSRIFLGAMLGVIVVVLFFPEFGEKIQLGNVSFGPAAAAFLAGLGIKPVYAAFESLSEELAKRFKGGKDETKSGGSEG